jgi:hypothetical protein
VTAEIKHAGTGPEQVPMVRWRYNDLVDAANRTLNLSIAVTRLLKQPGGTEVHNQLTMDAAGAVAGEVWAASEELLRQLEELWPNQRAAK